TDYHLRFHQSKQFDQFDHFGLMKLQFKDNWFRTFIWFYEGHIITVCLIYLRKLTRMKIFITWISFIFSNVDVVNRRCVRRGKVLRNPFFITEVDKNAIPEFNTIVSFELFDFDVILIFNSFDERHDSFRHSVQPVETSIPAATPALASLMSTSSGTRRNRKACFVCKSVDHWIKDCDYHAKKMAQPIQRNYAHRVNHKQYASLTHKKPQKHMVPTAVLTHSKPVFTIVVRPVSADVPKIMTSNSPPRVTAAQAPMVSTTQGNMSYLSDFEEHNGGYVAFGGNPKGGKIFGKGKIKTGKLDFEDVYFVKELKFNLFSVSQMCDKKNSVLFTDTECLVLSPDFKLPATSQVLLRVPRKNNMYNVNLKNIVPSGDLTCLFAKATIDESNLWHRKPDHINSKTINKLVKGNLVRGLPTKVFENDNTSVACKKGKQHRASCKTKPVSSVDQPFFRLHIDLFGPTFVKSLNKKSYCLVVTDDYSRFTWVFFLATKDETSPILKTFITGLENQLSLKVKVIRSDNGTEFKNSGLNQFCSGPTWLFDIDSLTRTMNYQLVNAGNQTNPSAGFQDKFDAEKAGEEINQQYVLFLMWSSGSTNPHNNDEDAAFDGKGCDFDVKNPKSEVILSPSSSAQSGKQDDKTKKEAKGKSHVESVTGYRDLNAEFEDCSDNSSNEINDAGSIVPTVGQHSLNSTNTFSAAGLSNVVVSPTYRKSLFIDASQLTEDPAMPELEDITYSDDENAVGAEADFNNLETSITEEPKRIHQAFKDPSWIEAMQEELLQFKMQKVWVLVYLPHGKRAIALNSSPTALNTLCFSLRSMAASTPKLSVCKKQTVVATSSTEAEYVPAASCCAQVLWIQNQLLDYGHKLLLFSLTNWCCSLGVVRSSRFNQIIDFLNGCYIKYALTVNPNIYVSCIKQFWNIVAIKQVNDVTRLQALVNKKKVVITEAAIREVVRLDDAEGVDCLPNEEIFTELARMGYEKPSTKLAFYKVFFSSLWKFLIHTILQSLSAKRTSWNEFSSAMAYIVIFLSTGKGFSWVETPLFDRMLVEQVIEEGGDMKKSMLQLILLLKEMILQLTEMMLKNHPYHLPLHLLHHHNHLKIFYQHPRRVEHLEYDKVAQAMEITKLKRRVKKLEKGNRAKVLKLRRLKRVGTSQRINTSEDTVMDDASNQGRIIDEMDKDDDVSLMDDKEEDKKEEEAKVVEDDQVQGRQAESQAEIYKIDLDHASKVLKVVTAASETVSATSTIISAAEPQVITATITAAPVRVANASTRRRKGVVIRDTEEESTTSSVIPVDTKSKDKGKWIMVEEPKPLKKKKQVEMDEEYARKLHAELNKDIDWDAAINHVKQKAKEDPTVQRLDYFKGMSYDDMRPIFKVKFNSNMDYLLKTKEQMEEEESRALQSINETPAQKAPKRRKLNEEVEDLKRHSEIVPDEDDDVYTEATPLARKVPVVDYEIINLNNKPYYKIIRADGTHQLYISFLTLLKNFDREDLEALWNLVKESFSTSKPKNFSDDFLLNTLGAMFEKPDRQAQVWKNQMSIHGQVKVKSWKLLESCGVHIITFSTTHLILLVERRYPLSRFTLNQMLNAVRLRVKEESEMSLELLRTPQQNGVAKRKNRTFIEAARTMVTDSLLPIPFWAEADNTACCSGPTWLFDIDSLSGTMNYHPATAGNQTNSAVVPIVRQNTLNSTNTFSAAGLSNTSVSLIYRDASQFPDDLDMP
nr:putative ribonuclease H-like domain-containing protein [Tanacetum cinerariifolium]